MNIKLYWHRYRYFPYEKKLAELEVLRLSGRVAEEFSDGLKIVGDSTSLSRLCRSTYFREITIEGQKTLIPIQAQLEASANYRLDIESKPGKRQVTRYSAHGLHEYRGKFNPQIVRAIGNIVGIKQGDWILDPFCGSGTTLLEAFHNGWNAVGLDSNPLAVQIANAKIAAIRLHDKNLHGVVESLSDALLYRIGHLTFETPLTDSEIRQIAGNHWQDWLPNYDYLTKWFILDVLVQFSTIFQEIDALLDVQAGLIARVILSDLVREVSLQDPSDLRIRRRKEFPDTYNVILPYVTALREKLNTIGKAKYHLSTDDSSQIAFREDIRGSYESLGNNMPQVQAEGFDGVITSPPYATGLPYVDTDRLSLVLFGLISADEIYDTQKVLIGSREISKLERDDLILAIDENQADLPEGVIGLCRALKKAVSSKDGFRRHNVPGVIYKYFSDMANGFIQVRQLLKDNAYCALVVGMNHTTLGGKKFIIDTPKLLIEIAAQYDLRLDKLIELDTYQRYDIHQANSIRSEYLIILKAV